eukprot:COSAG02_NODE_17341_length_1011_cov_0.794956_2_plen_201_part_00
MGRRSGARACGVGTVKSFARGPCEMPRVVAEAQEVERASSSRLCIAGVALVLLSLAIIVAVLVSCQAEGGWYCTTYGHPHPEFFKKIYELHGGEYGDLIFGSAQAVLISTLVAFPSTRRVLRRRYYCLWHKQGGLWHWAVLLFLPFLVFCGGLLNRIRGCVLCLLSDKISCAVHPAVLACRDTLSLVGDIVDGLVTKALS